MWNDEHLLSLKVTTYIDQWLVEGYTGYPGRTHVKVLTADSNIQDALYIITQGLYYIQFSHHIDTFRSLLSVYIISVTLIL